jgi:hypothetical protein
VDSWVALGVGPGLFGDVRAAGHGLHRSGAVAHLQEGDLPGRAFVGDPAAHGDALAGVLGKTGNRNDGKAVAHKGRIVADRSRIERPSNSANLG